MQWLKGNINLSYSLGVGRPKIKLRSLLESLGENPLPCLFPFLEAACYLPWLVSPSIFKASRVASSHLNLCLSFISAFVITSSDSDPPVSSL